MTLWLWIDYFHFYLCLTAPELTSFHPSKLKWNIKCQFWQILLSIPWSFTTPLNLVCFPILLKHLADISMLALTTFCSDFLHVGLPLHLNSLKTKKHVLFILSLPHFYLQLFSKSRMQPDTQQLFKSTVWNKYNY